MDPPPKFDLNVKTGGAAHSSRGYDKVYYSHKEAFGGEQGRLPNLAPKWLERGERDMLGVFLWSGSGAGVRAGVCIV